MTEIHLIRIESPIGELIACATDVGICMLEISGRKNIDRQFNSLLKLLSGYIVENETKYLKTLKLELAEYFEGKRRVFTVPLHLVGTEFHKKVWNELLKIPYGKTVSYKQVAENIGNPKAVRAVANANALNKISIIVPCHRVIGSNGSLTGYASGLDNKRWLLRLENNG